MPGQSPPINRKTLVPRLSIISNVGNNFGQGSSTIATAGSYVTGRIRHQNKTGKVVTSLVPVYANYGPASSTEGANSAQLTVKAAIELSGTATDQSGPRVPVQWPSGTVATPVDRRAMLYGRAIACAVPADGYFYERAGITVSTNGDAYQRGAVARGGTTQWGLDTGEGVVTSDMVQDGTGTITNNVSSCYSASVMLGTLADGSVAKSVAILGDSIAAGVDDAGWGQNNGGWVKRAFIDYPMVWLPIAGEKLSQAVLRNNFYSRFELATYATHILDQYGRNDIGASQSLATIQANILAMAYLWMAIGKTYIKATVLPSPTSTDGWFTVANQTKESSTFEDVRVALNSWLRDTSASGFVAQASAQVASVPSAGAAKVCDPCAGYECDINGVLTLNGGYVLGAAGGVLATGTATSATTTVVNDTGKAFTVNAFKGKSLYIASGTGSGQSRCIAYNSATQINTVNAFTTSPDATSVYQVFDGIGFTSAVHPHTRGCTLAAAAINAAALMT